MNLEDRLAHRRNRFTNAANIWLSIGSSLAAAGMVGIDGLTVPPTYILAEYFKEKNITTADFRNEMLVGSIQTVTTVYPAYRLMNYVQPAVENAVAEAGYTGYSYLTGLAARVVMNVGLYLPLVILNYYVTSHLVKKRTFKGLYKDVIKSNFKKDVIRAYKWLGVPIMLAAVFVPPYFHILTSAILRFTFRSLIGKKSRKTSINYRNNHPQLQTA